MTDPCLLCHADPFGAATFTPQFGMCPNCFAAFVRDLRDLLTIELKQRRAKMTPEERAAESASRAYTRKRGAR